MLFPVGAAHPADGRDGPANGSLDRDALLKKTREKPEMERLNLAEANFYIGQQLAARGQREEALRWFARTADSGASPYRETTFAQLELQRAKTAAGKSGLASAAASEGVQRSPNAGPF